MIKNRMRCLARTSELLVDTSVLELGPKLRVYPAKTSLDPPQVGIL
jgi:hypothetical protein